MKTGYTYRCLLVAALLLAACSRGSTEDPAVVLKRASSVAQQLQSAAFDVTFSYDAGSQGMSIHGTAVGSVADSGHHLSFTFDADTSVPQDGVDRTVSAGGDVIVAGENEAYIRLSKLDGSVLFLPGIGLIPDSSIGTWYLAGNPTSERTTISPDPSFIAMQMRTITVTHDRSYEKVDGYDCTVYDVTIDPRAMVDFLEETAAKRSQPFDRQAAETFVGSFEANGTVWIDRETSVVRRISWTFESAPGTGDMHGSFSLHLRDHNVPVEISPPPTFSPLSDVLVSKPLPAL
jgi:hypothetical protein